MRQVLLFRAFCHSSHSSLAFSLNSGTSRPTANKDKEKLLSNNCLAFFFDHFCLSPCQVVLNKNCFEILTARAASLG